MKVKALIPVYGSNRMLGEYVGAALKGCSWVGIPFAGGLCEVPYIDARTIVANDLNRAAMNLAMAVRSDQCHALMNLLEFTAFHPDELAVAQETCRNLEKRPLILGGFNLQWARAYFVCAWMARNGTAGTDSEFNTGLSVRWNAGGGDSVVRFRNATEALTDWHKTLARATFQTLDAFEFIDKCKDEPGHGIYCDPPWPDDGDQYKHKFGIPHQKVLVGLLRRFKKARVVIRYGDHPLIRELYPEKIIVKAASDMSAAALESGANEEEIDGPWEWRRFTGRTSANKGKQEVLIVNRA